MKKQSEAQNFGEQPGASPGKPPDRLLWLWRKGEPIRPTVTRLNVRFEVALDDEELARAAGLGSAAVADRRRRGNQPYLARIGEDLAAYGWACRGTAECGCKNLPFIAREGDCYLWDFATLPRWRGNGLYPSLLAWILGRDESVLRYWIMHQRTNEASRRGIERAGFRLVAALHDQPDGRFRIEPLAGPDATRLVMISFADLIAPQKAVNDAA